MVLEASAAPEANQSLVTSGSQWVPAVGLLHVRLVLL